MYEKIEKNLKFIKITCTLAYIYIYRDFLQHFLMAVTPSLFFLLIYGFSTKEKHNYFSNKFKKKNSDTFLKLIL
jgi:hypothetical protein